MAKKPEPTKPPGWAKLRRRTKPPRSRRPQSFASDDADFVVFCFAEPEDAEAFADGFGGKRLRPVRRITLKASGATRAPVQHERMAHNVSPWRKTGLTRTGPIDGKGAASELVPK
jgi:hypothetical protein